MGTKAISFNEERLHQLLGTAVNEAGAVMQAPLMLIGSRLGLYRALAEGGPATSTELARRTQTTERYVREWLRSQAAAGWVEYDSATDSYKLTPEQAMLLADEKSPVFLVPAFEIALAASKSMDQIEERFRTGKGFGWGEHDPGVPCGTERFFGTVYRTNLVQSWIPALDGVEEKLKRGAEVADIGCGHGASTILMAEAYPNSRFAGYDYHENSMQTASERARQAGVAGRVRFQPASAQTFDGGPYHLVTTFDALHDMGDPVGAARRVREKLRDDGVWMIVEPKAGDRVEENLNPVGRLFYSASTMVCTPCSLSQDVGLALGAQAGEAKIREVTMLGGFTQFRRATETPFNLVFEARP